MGGVVISESRRCTTLAFAADKISASFFASSSSFPHVVSPPLTAALLEQHLKPWLPRLSVLVRAAVALYTGALRADFPEIY